MQVKQISVFLENKAGRLSRVCDVLAEGNINIRALSLADTSDFGILRLIVNRPDEACDLLSKEGFAASTNSVIAVPIEDKPGGLAKILRVFQESNVNLEYMYAFMSAKCSGAIMVCKVGDSATALAALEKAGIGSVSEDELYGER